jgi:hypothetical protein
VQAVAGMHDVHGLTGAVWFLVDLHVPPRSVDYLTYSKIRQVLRKV